MAHLLRDVQAPMRQYQTRSFIVFTVLQDMYAYWIAVPRSYTSLKVHQLAGKVDDAAKTTVAELVSKEGNLYGAFTSLPCDNALP